MKPLNFKRVSINCTFDVTTKQLLALMDKQVLEENENFTNVAYDGEGRKIHLAIDNDYMFFAKEQIEIILSKIDSNPIA